MGRKATGYVEWRGGRWQVQTTEPDGSRPWRDLPKSVREDQAELAREVGRAMVAKLRAGEYVPAEREKTVAEWFKEWFAWRTARGLGDAKKHAGQFCKYLEKDLGHLPMRAVGRGHIKAIVAKLDAMVTADEISWKTAVNVWGCLVSKPFKDATNGKNPALCVLDDNPAAGVAPPDKGARTKKQYLYPNEAYALFLCEDIPLWRRRLYAFAIYTYMRTGEIAAL
jgi:hypothetical protein